MRIALIGRPGSGKTTLFNALGGAREKHPGLLSDERPVVSVEVPDSRLDFLAELYKPKKYTPARIEFADFPGLPPREEKGKAELQAAIREADGLALVVRAFESAEYAYENSLPDPLVEVREVLEDLLLGDYAILEKRVEKLRVQAHKPTRTQDQDRHELVVLEHLLGEVVEKGRDLRDVELSRDEEQVLRGFRFASQKPVLVLINAASMEVDLQGFASALACPPERLLCVVAAIEEEIASLEPGDRQAFLEEYGISAPVRERIIQTAYQGLGLCSFLTTGSDEVRAWTIHRDERAVDAAAKIHSDIARGFIRAETVAFTDLEACGDMRAAKAANKVRLEGKEYRVQDGDVINFRFSV